MISALLLPALALLASPGADPTADPRAGFDWPVAGVPVVERRFDPPATDYGAGHRGVDLAADPGDDVLAAGPGTVTYAGLLAGRGVVAVTHAGGLRTTYEPVDAAVDVGDLVAQGDVLGTVGRGHGSCRWSTCLHWGLRRGDAYLDPLALVLGAPVRLLPVGSLGLGPPPSSAVRVRAPSPTAVRPARADQEDETGSSTALLTAGVGLAGLAGASVRSAVRSAVRSR